MPIIKGKVTDTNSQPVTGAKIFTQDRTSPQTKTDANGQYQITLPNGKYSIKCRTLHSTVQHDKVGVFKDIDSLDFVIPIRSNDQLDDFVEAPPGEPVPELPLQDKITPVRLFRTRGKRTADELFWQKIKSKSIDFTHYRNCMDDIMNCNLGNIGGLETLYASKTDKLPDKTHLPFNRSEAYSLLKFATEKYVERMLGLTDSDLNGLAGYLRNGRIPYYDLVLSKINEFIPDGDECDDPSESYLTTVTDPILIELIWSYWHEEGMLVQAMNAINRRFQNIRNGNRDPLANLEIDPLRPLNNIFWGYIQDSQHRLTISRRTYEYDHHYGIRLLGKAIPDFSPADSRSKFLQSFHNLLYRCSLYFKESDDTTIFPDAFPVLNALRETHLILAEGAHNQFGDLPTVSRIEMLMEQWILSRPEIREFLGGRVMVPYDEPWMDRVDTMKTLQGWTSTSVSYFHDLARFGEQIILGIRYGNWSQINDRDSAGNWADFWRDAIQRYIHSYYTVTGVDLSAEAFDRSKEERTMMPAFLIHQKFQQELALKRG
jgi:hypothetical protein